jgi:hypothetical protein
MQQTKVQKTYGIFVGISRIIHEKGRQHSEYVASPLYDFQNLFECSCVDIGKSRILRNNDGEVCVVRRQNNQVPFIVSAANTVSSRTTGISSR